MNQITSKFPSHTIYMIMCIINIECDLGFSLYLTTKIKYNKSINK